MNRDVPRSLTSVQSQGGCDCILAEPHRAIHIHPQHFPAVLIMQLYQSLPCDLRNVTKSVLRGDGEPPGITSSKDGSAMHVLPREAKTANRASKKFRVILSRVNNAASLTETARSSPFAYDAREYVQCTQNTTLALIDRVSPQAQCPHRVCLLPEPCEDRLIPQSTSCWRRGTC